MVMLHLVSDEEKDAVRSAYLRRHPEAFWVDFGDFRFLHIKPKAMRYVSGVATAILGSGGIASFTSAERAESVTMQVPNEIPQDHHCKDKFLIQSIVVQDGTTHRDIVPDMFNRAPGRVVEEFKLRVVYIPANPPSPDRSDCPKQTQTQACSLAGSVSAEQPTDSANCDEVTSAGVQHHRLEDSPSGSKLAAGVNYRILEDSPPEEELGAGICGQLNDSLSADTHAAGVQYQMREESPTEAAIPHGDSVADENLTPRQQLCVYI